MEAAQVVPFVNSSYFFNLKQVVMCSSPNNNRVFCNKVTFIFLMFINNNTKAMYFFVHFHTIHTYYFPYYAINFSVTYYVCSNISNDEGKLHDLHVKILCAADYGLNALFRGLYPEVGCVKHC